MYFICGGQRTAYKESVLSFNHMGPRVELELSSKDLYPLSHHTDPSASQSAVRMLKDAAVITQEHLATERNHWAQPGGWQHPENFWKNKAVCGVNREKWPQIASTNFGNDNNYISNLKRKQLSSERGGGEGDWEHAYKLGGNQREAEDERRRSHQNKEQRAARWE